MASETRGSLRQVRFTDAESVVISHQSSPRRYSSTRQEAALKQTIVELVGEMTSHGR